MQDGVGPKVVVVVAFVLMRVRNGTEVPAAAAVIEEKVQIAF